MAYPTDPTQVGLTVAKNTLTLVTGTVAYSNQTVTGRRFRNFNISVTGNVTFQNCWFYRTTGFASTLNNNGTGLMRFIDCQWGYDGEATAEDPIGGVWDPNDYLIGMPTGGGSVEYTSCLGRFVKEGPRIRSAGNTTLVDYCWIGDMWLGVGDHGDAIQSLGIGIDATITDNYLQCGPPQTGPFSGEGYTGANGWTDALNLSGATGDAYVARNLLLSENNTLRVDAGVNLTLIYNKFDDDPTPIVGTGSPTIRYENRYLSTNELIPGDQVDPNGAHVFPSVRSSNFNATASGTSHVVSMPASITAGDLLIIRARLNNPGVTVTGPAGWTEISGAGQPEYTWAKIAAGSDTATITTSGNRVFCFVDVSVQDWFGTIATGVAIVSGSGSDPGSLSPAWGSADTLWFVTATASAGTLPAISAWSTGFTEVAQVTVDATVDAVAGMAQRQEATATKDPDGVTFSGSPVTTNTGTIAVRPQGVPAAPGNPAAVTVSDTAIDITWDNVAGETGFRVERSPDGIGTWTDESGNLAPDTLTFSDTGLVCNTQYFYRVFAFNGSGDSAASSTVNATTSACAGGGGNRMGGTGAIRKSPRPSRR